MDVRVLGPLEVAHEGVPLELRGDRIRTLLAVLAERPGSVVPIDRLSDAIWGGEPPATAASSLRMLVSRLRQRLAVPGVEGVEILADPPGYRLVAPHDAVDHVRFRTLVADARAAEDDGRRGAATRLLRESLALWRGQAFDGIDVPAVAATARHLDALHLDAQDRLFRLRLEAGERDTVVPDLEAAVAANPGRERLTGQLMLALYRAGRQAEALAAYQRLRDWLVDEMGLSPSRQLESLEAAILRQDPALDLRLPELDPAQDAAAQAVQDLPASLTVAAADPFVGRDDERRVLRGRFGRPRPDPAPVHLLLGPAGVGKSRLLAEVAQDVAGDGVVVLHGWADPGAVVPFALLRRATEPLRSRGGTVAEALDVAGAAVGRSGGARSRDVLLGSVDALLDELTAGGRTPVMVVLDDVQWADSVSLAVLHHIARRAVPGLGLLLAARTGEPPAPAWRGFMADVSSIPGLQTTELHGLDVPAITDLLDLRDPDRGGHRTTASRLHAATNGNPFFLLTLLRQDREEPPVLMMDAPRVPAVAEAVLARRVADLPDGTVDLLRTAAVLGPSFDRDLLATLAGVDHATVVEALAPAFAAGVVRERPDEPGTVAFDHELLRRSLLDHLPPDVRRRHHLAAAGLLGERADRPIARAYHLYRARPLAPVEEVLAAMEHAVDVALELTAWQEAMASATAVLELCGPDDHARRVDALIRLGRAVQSAEGREAAMPTFVEALDLALDAGLVDKVDEVLLAATMHYAALTPGDPVMALVERVVSHASGLGGPALAEIVVQRIAAEGVTEELGTLLAHVAASTPDPEGSPEIAHAQMYAQVGLPDPMPGRAAAARVKARSGGSAVEPNLLWIDGSFFTIGFALLGGDMRTAGAELRSFSRAVARSDAPVFRWLELVIRADLALDAGRFEEAAGHAGQALAFGLEHELPDAQGSYGLHMLVTSLLRGGTGQVLPMVEQAVAGMPEMIPYRAALAVARAETGDADGAVELLPALADDLEVAPPSMLTPLNLALTAWTVARTGDVATAERVGPLVREWSGTVPRTAMVGASMGPMDRLLGLLQVTCGDLRAGVASLRRALAQAEAMAAEPWAVACRVDLAAHTTDADEAVALRAAARSGTSELGMAPWLARLDTDGPDRGRGAGLLADTPPTERPPSVPPWVRAVNTGAAMRSAHARNVASGWVSRWPGRSCPARRR